MRRWGYRVCSALGAVIVCLTTGCDTGAPMRPAQAPFIVRSSLVGRIDGAFNANVNLPIEFDYDQILSPRSVVRANFSLRSADLGVNLRLRWEPVQRRVQLLFSPAEIRPELEYILTIRDGLLSWDGVPTGRTTAYRLRFYAGDLAVAPSVVSFSADIAPLFRRSCVGSGCHGPREPVMGLDLSSSIGVATSAIGVLSRENPSMTGGIDRTEPQWSGIPRIAPGEPEQSYLVYKIVGAGPMRGSPMPFNGTLISETEQLQISTWIQQGARLDN